MKRLLITLKPSAGQAGISGFLGAHLAKIASKDYIVYGLFRSFPVNKPGMRTFQVDLTSEV